MKIIQLKSTCCGGAVRRYGERRRQCRLCYKTWRIRLKKRGRNARRPNNDNLLLRRYLSRLAGGGRQLSYSSRYPSEAALAKRLRLARDRFLAAAWSSIPGGPLILIADALQYQHTYQYRSLYLMLVRPAGGSQAVILPPVGYPGKECQRGWQTALASIDREVLSRIQALVCDGHRGLVYGAKNHGWIIQRCHFHLKKGLNNYLRTGISSKRQLFAREVHDLVDSLLTSSDDRRVYEQVLPQLEWCTRLAPSKGARRVLFGLVHYCQDFRAYIYQDELCLPKTSNTAESAVNIIRSLEKRAYGWATPASFEAWATATLKHKSYINCHESQPN